MFARIATEYETAEVIDLIREEFEREGLVDATKSEAEREAEAVGLIIFAARLPWQVSTPRLRDWPARLRIRSVARRHRDAIRAIQRPPKDPWYSEDDTMRWFLSRL